MFISPRCARCLHTHGKCHTPCRHAQERTLVDMTLIDSDLGLAEYNKRQALYKQEEERLGGHYEKQGR